MFKNFSWLLDKALQQLSLVPVISWPAEFSSQTEGHEQCVYSIESLGVGDKNSVILVTVVSNLLRTPVRCEPDWLMLYKQGPTYISRAVYWHVGLQLNYLFPVTKSSSVFFICSLTNDCTIISNTIITNNMLQHISTFKMSSSGSSLCLLLRCKSTFYWSLSFYILTTLFY